VKKFALKLPAGVDKDLAVNPDLHVTRDTPPQFLLQAEDDHVDGVDSLAYYIALKNAGVATEMHLYARGGHAFGLRKTRDAITDWPALVDVWMKSIGMVP
jgi:acetyl esterase/lipase